MKKRDIHRRFEELFGSKLQSKTFDYVPTEHDLYEVAEIFNAYVFNGKFDLNDIEIMVVEKNSCKDKGAMSFGKNKKPTAKYLIRIFKSSHGDNFYQIVNVLAHELIHVHDYMFGEISHILKAHCGEALSGFYVVTTADQKQYVGVEHYDAHGKFFSGWAKKFNSLGFNVQPLFNVNGPRQMKKLKEQNQDEKHDFFYETENAKEMLTYKAIRRVFDIIVAPNKRLVYRNAKQWFIEFP